MIKKVLIAEDIDSVRTGIIAILKDKFNFTIDHSNSCDNAYLKILRANQDKQPYDLIITDLYFKVDEFISQKLITGEDLVKAAKKIQPSIKSIVYTVESRPLYLKKLKVDTQINGIVIKGHQSLIELCNAIIAIQDGTNYFTSEVEFILKNDSSETIKGYDIKILELLANGYTQQEISAYLKNQNIKPSSVSAIEKRIGELKQTLSANNSIHMVAIAKDMNII